MDINDTGIILFLIGLFLAFLLIGRGFRVGRKSGRAKPPKWRPPHQNDHSGKQVGGQSDKGEQSKWDDHTEKPKHERKHDKDKPDKRGRGD